ncbi:hypothetical protein M422DRAFT_258004 [Sphaerobolus stellatus SS14]|uniref:Uncharacterized protein n=1 Tax=Sphaerobolus stellatus (strain SS14) TaxID=990650 RepID=A0A0C9UW72_SPHS4|nr:hypothetical protein M422DRAFT_258004 [Sphaerobolus stellatus SS14]
MIHNADELQLPNARTTPSDSQLNNQQHSSPHADTHPESPRSSLPSPPSTLRSSFSSLPSLIFSLSLSSSPPPSLSLSLSFLSGGRHRPEHEHDLKWDVARVLNNEHNINTSLSFSTHISQSFILPSLSLSLSDLEHDHKEDASATILIWRRERERAQRRVVLSSEDVANTMFLILGAHGSGTIGVVEEHVSYGNHVLTREGESERKRKDEDYWGCWEWRGNVRGYVMEYDEEADVEDLVRLTLDAIHALTIPSSSSLLIPIFTALIPLISPNSFLSSSSLQTRLTPYISIIFVTFPGEPLISSTLLSCPQHSSHVLNTSLMSSTLLSSFSSQFLSAAMPNPLHLNSEPLSPHSLHHALFHPQMLAQLHDSAQHKLLTSSYYASSQARTPGPTVTVNSTDLGKTREQMGLHYRHSISATITGRRPTLPPPFSLGYHGRFTGSGESAILSRKSSSGSGGRSSPNYNPTLPNHNHKPPSQVCISHVCPMLSMQLDPLHILSLLFLSFSLLKESMRTLGMYFSVFPSHYQYQHQDEGWKRERGSGIIGRPGWVAVTVFLSGVGVGWVVKGVVMKSG